MYLNIILIFIRRKIYVSERRGAIKSYVFSENNTDTMQCKRTQFLDGLRHDKFLFYVLYE